MSDDVAAGERDGNGFGLDGGRLLEAEFFNGGQQFGVDAEIRKH